MVVFFVQLHFTTRVSYGFLSVQLNYTIRHVNSLIESVNPVKLYEYILSGIPSMACGYSESEKFSDYVYLYYNEKDYMDFISMLLQEKLPTKNKNGKYFVSNNTWSHRAKEIHKILNTAGAF